ncbi:hypothetical protein G5V58_03965 [Nocardioides anomalus]|uniref:DUF4411 family protein n=1 Tax=Nocardioides anomalus TaxID=2712223 RepID=A0A6G6W9L9_9ACTN|nr:hypothetical protein [Nocardioides anomalus]QIG42038.1 hypothetical protein G5V58_03965 [Nocardioides anomalus]
MFLPSEEGEDDARTDSAPEADSREEPDLVVVLDSSVIIQLKYVLPTEEQWGVFAAMLDLVRSGRLTFPRQVARELAKEKHPDAPGIWCGEAVRHVRHSNPTDETMSELLEWIGDLVEVDAEPDREPADPYIAATAWELLEAGYDVAVATEDNIDRLPLKIALTTACDRLGITSWGLDTFLAWVRGPEQGDLLRET